MLDLHNMSASFNLRYNVYNRITVQCPYMCQKVNESVIDRVTN